MNENEFVLAVTGPESMDFESKKNDIMLLIRDEYVSWNHFMANVDTICSAIAKHLKVTYRRDQVDGRMKIIFDF